eukprot:11200153-Ditylum_brightwellii.AAC.1
MLYVPKDHLMKERAEVENKDAVVMIAVEGAAEVQDAAKKSAINNISEHIKKNNVMLVEFHDEEE